MPSKRARLEYHGQEMVTLSGTRLNMCTKPQQIAEMNASYFQVVLMMGLDTNLFIINPGARICHYSPDYIINAQGHNSG